MSGKYTGKRPAWNTSQELSQAMTVASTGAGAGMEKGRRFPGYLREVATGVSMGLDTDGEL